MYDPILTVSLDESPAPTSPVSRAVAATPWLTTVQLSLVTVLVLLLVWWLVTWRGWVAPLFLPSPQAVLAKAWQVSTQGFMDATLWQHLAASLSRIGIALLAATLLAVPVGIAIGLHRWAQGIFDPLIELYRPIPPLAYLPLIVIWFGIGEFSKILLIYLAIFAPIVIATAGAVRAVDPNRLRAAQSLGASRGQLIWQVVLPSALPDILTGLRIGLGAGWSTLVAAELVAATRGLGFMVQSAAQFLVTDVVLLGIAVIALVAFSLELGLRWLQKRFVPWHGRA
ncbi:ABC transporter permease [Chitinimonas naiadis]